MVVGQRQRRGCGGCCSKRSDFSAGQKIKVHPD